MTTPRPGDLLLHYRILEKLGEGGMGSVFLAEDTKLNRMVALKFLPPEMLTNQERLQRFAREAKTVAALNHPNIVTLYSVEEAEGIPFISMELVDGDPLTEVIPEAGLSLENFLGLAIPIIDAVAAAHQRGITHRDIKPANIMVTREGRVKVLDFGLAKLLPGSDSSDANLASTQSLTQDGKALGTVTYMAPEHLKGRAPDQRADIFALGIVLYQMASGRRPFAGETSAEIISSILRDDPPSITDLRIELPTALGTVVRRCLEKNPARRYQTASELRRDLEALRESFEAGRLVAGGKSERGFVAPARRNRASRAQIGLAIGAVAIAVLTALLLLRIADSDKADLSPGSAALPTIAVLPFSEIGESGWPQFEEVLHQEISSQLTRLPGLQVVSQSAARQFSPASEHRIAGEQLGADYLVAGTIRWSADAPSEPQTAHTAVQVVRVHDDIQVWADTFDWQASDRPAVQFDVGLQVARGVGIAVLGMQPVDLSTALRTQEDDAAPSVDLAQTVSTPVDRAEVVPTPQGDHRTAAESEPETVVPPDLTASIDLQIELTSFETQGILTIYAGESQIFSEEFQFARKKGLLAKRRVAGTLSAVRSLPADTESLRIYIVVKGETTLTTLEPGFVPGQTRRLRITLNRKGSVEAVLE